MSLCLFVSDLHGSASRVRALLEAIGSRRPAAVFVGGDLLPHSGGSFDTDFAAGLRTIRDRLGPAYPAVFLILGNDDPRVHEPDIVACGSDGLWQYVHCRVVAFGNWQVIGYACVPPTPFHLKDWERYDVSRYVDPGCVSPEEGYRTVRVDPVETRYGTIAGDLDALAPEGPLDRTIVLFHSPPYDTALDRAALDGRSVDHVAVDVHVGSIAIRRFIARRQPAITLHGHVHESARLTGQWFDRIGRTTVISAAHDGPELALVTFRPESPHLATRELIPAM